MHLLNYTVFTVLSVFAGVCVQAMLCTSSLFAQNDFLEPLAPYLSRVDMAIAHLSEERRQALNPIADYVVEHLQTEEPVQLLFICTHNSRRSHLAQVFCQLAASYYQVPRIVTASGGTEVTACNIRTVRALRRSGLSVVSSTRGENPVYLIQYADSQPPLQAFSKLLSASQNPQTNFAALLCCSEADRSCPTVSGAAARFPLHYEDPKLADGTTAEAQRYDERALQIATEMFYVMSQVKSRVAKSQVD